VKNVLASLVVLVIVTGVAYRIIALGRVPGINGDETYYAVAAMNVRDGRPQPLVSGSGLPLNPLYIGPLYLLHLGHPTPSFTLVRLPALASGLLALALMYPLMVRVADRQAVLYATLLQASLPTAIAYSRFGWDQSQAPLIALLCIYCALRNWPMRLAISYAFALWIHPANVFLAPIVLGPIAARNVVTWQRRRSHAAIVRSLAATGGLAVAGAGLLVWFSPAVRDATALALGRTFDVSEWSRYVVAVGDLLSGLTIYRYIAGDPSHAWIILERSVFWSLTIYLLVRVLPAWLRSREGVKLGLLAGALIAILAFYVLMGAAALSPGWERYGVWIISPACLILGLLISSLGTSAASRSAQTIGVIAACVFMLVGFYRNYFAVLETSGGAASLAFRTGPVEPKQAAFDAILTMTSDEPGPVTVLAEDWWTYYPLRYLATERDTMTVVWPSGGAIAGAAAEPRHRFAVGFDHGPFHRWVALHAPELRRRTIVDSAGQPILHVWDLASRSDLQEALFDAARSEESR
jgi:hypothetical protein